MDMQGNVWGGAVTIMTRTIIPIARASILKGLPVASIMLLVAAPNATTGTVCAALIATRAPPTTATKTLVFALFVPSDDHKNTVTLMFSPSDTLNWE